MRISFCLLALLINPLVVADEPQVVPPRDASWRLVWSDEFNGNGPPDPSVWQFEQGFTRNKELQWYQPANAICRDGLLVFEARREQVRNPNYKKDDSSWKISREYAEYTSASIVTQKNRAWKYGRFEIRARFSALSGMWPAI